MGQGLPTVLGRASRGPMPPPLLVVARRTQPALAALAGSGLDVPALAAAIEVACSTAAIL